MFALEILLWLCRGHLVPRIETLGVFILAVSTALFVSGTDLDVVSGTGTVGTAALAADHHFVEPAAFRGNFAIRS